MAAKARWVRLSIDFDDSAWITPLSDSAQLAWVKLLCHVKREGGGRCRAISPLALAKRLGINDHNGVIEMLREGIGEGAIIEADGCFIVAKWDDYQRPDTTNTDRQKRFKEKHSSLDNGVIDAKNALITQDNAVTLSCATNDREINNKKRITNKGKEGSGEETPKRDNAVIKTGDLIPLLPQTYDVPALRTAWEDFTVHRKQKGQRPYTPKGLEMLAGIIVRAEISAENLGLLLNRAVVGQWQGLPPDAIQQWASGPPRASPSNGRPAPSPSVLPDISSLHHAT